MDKERAREVGWEEGQGVGGGKELKGRDGKGEGDWMGDGQRAPYSIPFLEHKCCM